MKARAAQLLSVCALLTVLLGGCVGERLTKANVDQVSNGMAKKQVESVLGPPTTVEDVRTPDLRQKTTYIYTQGKDTVTIVFFDDKLESKQTTLTD